MKKILLSGFLALSVLISTAQTRNPITQSKQEQNRVIKGKPAIANSPKKKTRGGSRWYNVVDATNEALGGQIYNNFQNNVNTAIVWHDSTMKALYGDGNGGVVQEAIWVKGFGQVIDPASAIFNDATVFPGEIEIKRGKTYTVDSVGVYCIYERSSNPAKQNVVDTLIISVANSSDLFLINETQTAVTNNYSTDTLKNADFSYNFSTNAIKGSSTIIKKIPLTASSVNDTLESGWNYFATPINLTVAAGGLNLAGMTAVFKSGDTWTPLVDSCGSGSNVIYNRLRLVSFEESENTFRSYTKGDYNSSQLMRNDTTGWGEDLIPSFYFTSTAYAYEQHWFEWKLSCATCNPVSIDAVNNIISQTAVYPNPTNSVVNFDFYLQESAKNVTIELTNLVGQVVKTKTLNNVNANTKTNANISVADLTSGLYIYTIHANGQKVSNKLMIK